MKLDLEWTEKVILCKSLIDEDYFSLISEHLKTEHFSNKNYAFVFDVVKYFFDARKQLPSATEIRSYLQTDEQKRVFKNVLDDLTNVETELNKDELYNNTERFIKERSIYQTLLKVAKDIGDGNIDTSNILNQFEQACNVSFIHDIGTNLYKDFHKIREHILQPEPTISTGYKWLDEKIGGGFLRDGRAMYVFAGETNIGKSIVLGNFAINLARQKLNVLVITLEMSEMVYSKRLLANISDIPTSKLKDDIEIVQAQIENFNSSARGNIIVKEFPPSMMTPRDIHNYISKVIKSGIQIGAIVLDYVNLLTSSKGKDSYERLKYICEEIRATTYTFKCPLITVTQLNRCLDVSSTVITDKGNRAIGDIQKGDRILGKDGFVEVRYVYPKTKQLCYKIKTRSGREIICSSKHIFPTHNDFKSIDTGLRKGDKLLSLTEWPGK